MRLKEKIKNNWKENNRLPVTESQKNISFVRLTKKLTIVPEELR
jgi:hypothetical protein